MPALDLPAGLSHRDAMRAFVVELSSRVKARLPGFQIITQNGNELFSAEQGSRLSAAYAAALDAVGQESLWYGNPAPNKSSPAEERAYMSTLLRGIRALGKSVLVTDYCDRPDLVADAQSRNAAEGFLSFPAHRRALDGIPPLPTSPPGLNSADIHAVGDARNFLYLINPEKVAFPTRRHVLDALAGTPHDVIIIDLFFEDQALTQADLDRLRFKPQGGRRLLIAYLSIGEAEDYRYYWQPAWKTRPPAWLDAENPDWKGNYRVRYWDKDWQALIFGSPEAYLERIQAAGFDGVYLDTIDTYEYFETK
jgi:cysteinyl-tRNA synthetase